MVELFGVRGHFQSFFRRSEASPSLKNPDILNWMKLKQTLLEDKGVFPKLVGACEQIREDDKDETTQIWEKVGDSKYSVVMIFDRKQLARKNSEQTAKAVAITLGKEENGKESLSVHASNMPTDGPVWQIVPENLISIRPVDALDFKINEALILAQSIPIGFLEKSKSYRKIYPIPNAPKSA